MNGLIIGPVERDGIRRMREMAAARPIKITPEMDGGGTELVHLKIPIGYQVTYSIDLQPSGPWRHLGLYRADGRDPHPAAVSMLMEEFGFLTPLRDCVVYRTPGQGEINVTEPLDGNWERVKRGS